MGVLRPVLRPGSVLFQAHRPLFSTRGGGGLSAYMSQMAFWSDGTIEDGKLTNLKGDQTMSPSLVESNCLDVAINDTITYADLSGWSIVSSGGTAVIAIDGNTIKCTTAGTLYKMILSNGTHQHLYPLAEGGHTIAYDVSDNPSHGTISTVGEAWTTQDEYHYNVNGANYRDGIDTHKQSVFVDTNADGIPDGWTQAFAKGGVTTDDGVVRVTKNASMTSYYHMEITRPGVLTIGVNYRLTVNVRANKVAALQVRYGTFNTLNSKAINTEWQEIEFIATVADGNDLQIVGTIDFGVDDWFEIKYVLVEQVVNYYYSPIKSNGLLDVYSDDVLAGNGHFINIETNLKFPDNATYQALDGGLNLEFVYDKDGLLRSISYNNLYDNVYGLDRAFNQKTDGRLTRMILVDHSNFTRSQFKGFIRAIGEKDYVYNYISKGCLIWNNLFSFVDLAVSDNLDNISALMNDKGASTCLSFGESQLSDLSTSQKTKMQQWIIAGNHLIGRVNLSPIMRGMASFEFLAGEEVLFADEITSGDIIAVDAPVATRGAIVKCNFPDFTIAGTLTTVSKTTGTVNIGDATLAGYGNLFWIPAGQSGVPASLAEKPMYIRESGTDATRMKYYQWNADEFFGETFTNSNDIQVYVIEKNDYDHLFSSVGMNVLFQHVRNNVESGAEITVRIVGYLESHGMMVDHTVTDNALWDAGMLFGSNGTNISTQKTTVFNNQKTIRNWSTSFGHNLWDELTAEQVLNEQIPLMAAKNSIREADFFHLGTNLDIAGYQNIIAACDANGVFIMSPVDFIKNLQFNDYNEADFFTE